MKFVFLLFLLEAFLSGCRTMVASQLKDSASANASVPPLVCERGEPSSFFLQKTKNPQLTDLLLPPFTDRTQVSVDDSSQLQLDVCLVDEEPLLERVLLAKNDSLFIWAGKTAQVKGLKALLFEEKSQGFEIRLPSKREPARAMNLFVLGASSAGKAIFAAEMFTGLDGGLHLAQNSGIHVGQLEYSENKFPTDCAHNPAMPTCLAGPEPRFKNPRICNEDSNREDNPPFTIGTAKISFRFCRGYGAGESQTYEIVRIAVTDSNPQLPENARKEFIVEGRDEIDEVLHYTNQHHNACDSFYLDLGDREYAATSAPLAGCGRQVEFAPKMEWDGPSLTKFRARYLRQEWVDSSTNCQHYMKLAHFPACS